MLKSAQKTCANLRKTYTKLHITLTEIYTELYNVGWVPHVVQVINVQQLITINGRLAAGWAAGWAAAGRAEVGWAAAGCSTGWVCNIVRQANNEYKICDPCSGLARCTDADHKFCTIIVSEAKYLIYIYIYIYIYTYILQRLNNSVPRKSSPFYDQAEYSERSQPSERSEYPHESTHQTC